MATDIDKRPTQAGVAFVAGGALLIATSVWLLPGDGAQRLHAAAVAVAMALAGGVAWLVLPDEHAADRLLIFPLIVFAGLAVLGTTDATIGAAYGGLITIAFIYLGLCCSTRSILLAVAPAMACWYLASGGANGVLAGALVVRMPIAVVIWCAVGLLLAQHVQRVEYQASALLDQAHRDPLTGLHNRRALAGLSKSAAPGDALVLLDLDHFKSVNDIHGHLAGDMLLADFAELLRASLRSADVAVRYGGEEFLLFLPATTPDQVHIILNRMQRTWASTGPAVTFSAGGAAVSSNGGIIAALGLADQRLYDAKSAGRNTWVIDEPSIPEQVQGSLTLVQNDTDCRRVRSCPSTTSH
jgi:diguanylate cyclase (GGDEF)-like protein